MRFQVNEVDLEVACDEPQNLQENVLPNLLVTFVFTARELEGKCPSVHWGVSQHVPGQGVCPNMHLAGVCVDRGNGQGCVVVTRVVNRFGGGDLCTSSVQSLPAPRRRTLKRAVAILLECLLVFFVFLGQ